MKNMTIPTHQSDWTEHINNMVENVEKSSSILERLAAKKWGCAMDVINNTYCTYLTPNFQYDEVIFIR